MDGHPVRRVLETCVTAWTRFGRVLAAIEGALGLLAEHLAAYVLSVLAVAILASQLGALRWLLAAALGLVAYGLFHGPTRVGVEPEARSNARLLPLVAGARLFREALAVTVLVGILGSVFSELGSLLLPAAPQGPIPANPGDVDPLTVADVLAYVREIVGGPG